MDDHTSLRAHLPMCTSSETPCQSTMSSWPGILSTFLPPPPNSLPQLYLGPQGECCLGGTLGCWPTSSSWLPRKLGQLSAQWQCGRMKKVIPPMHSPRQPRPCPWKHAAGSIPALSTRHLRGQLAKPVGFTGYHAFLKLLFEPKTRPTNKAPTAESAACLQPSGRTHI